MGKKSRQKKERAAAQANQTQGQGPSDKKASSKSAGSGAGGYFWPRNIISGGLAILFIALVYKSTASYQWVYTMVKSNLETIDQFSHLSMEERFNAKLGFDYQYINSLKVNTPDDAVIIMAPEASIKKATVAQRDASGGVSEQKAFKWLHSLAWSSYFVYPRKLVFEDEKDAMPSLYSKATHIGVVDYWGYQKIEYLINEHQKFTVIPINAKAENERLEKLKLQPVE